MTYLPFLPKLDAMEVLERHFEDEQARSEIEAELGSSLFYGGMSSQDAAFFAREQLDTEEQEYKSTPEGQLFTAQVEAAQFVRGATRGLEVFTQADKSDPRVWVSPDAQIVPEFWPGVIVKSDFLSSPVYVMSDFTPVEQDDLF